MIAIIIALVVLFGFVLCMVGLLNEKIKNQVDNVKRELLMEKEYWASKYHIEFSRMQDQVSKCESLLEKLQKNARIRAMLKKFPALNETFFRNAVRHVLHSDYKETNIEMFAEKLNKMVEPFLPHEGSDKPRRK